MFEAREYERELAYYLRIFYSPCDDASRRRMPLYAMIEHDEETVVSGHADYTCARRSDEFSTAPIVHDDDVSYRRHPSSSSSPGMKRTQGSVCLLDLVDDFGGDCDGGSRVEIERHRGR